MTAGYIVAGALLLLWAAGGLYRRRKNRNRVVSLDVSRCTGCCRCVKRCSRRVLEAVKDEAGMRVAVKYPDRCTACGDCLGRCKLGALTLTERV
jgi:NAD-dependent dihydropyrimidine dehydrogenase PreA subunit